MKDSLFNRCVICGTATGIKIYDVINRAERAVCLGCLTDPVLNQDSIMTKATKQGPYYYARVRAGGITWPGFYTDLQYKQLNRLVETGKATIDFELTEADYISHVNCYAFLSRAEELSYMNTVLVYNDYAV